MPSRAHSSWRICSAPFAWQTTLSHTSMTTEPGALRQVRPIAHDMHAVLAARGLHRGVRLARRWDRPIGGELVVMDERLHRTMDEIAFGVRDERIVDADRTRGQLGEDLTADL